MRTFKNAVLAASTLCAAILAATYADDFFGYEYDEAQEDIEAQFDEWDSPALAHDIEAEIDKWYSKPCVQLRLAVGGNEKLDEEEAANYPLDQLAEIAIGIQDIEATGNVDRDQMKAFQGNVNNMKKIVRLMVQDETWGKRRGLYKDFLIGCAVASFGGIDTLNARYE